MNLADLIKAKLAAGLEHHHAVESAESQVIWDAQQEGRKLTEAELQEIALAKAGIPKLPDANGVRNGKIAVLTAGVRISPKVRELLEGMIRSKMAAGLDRRHATQAALAQIENDGEGTGEDAVTLQQLAAAIVKVD